MSSVSKILDNMKIWLGKAMKDPSNVEAPDKETAISILAIHSDLDAKEASNAILEEYTKKGDTSSEGIELESYACVLLAKNEPGSIVVISSKIINEF
jgi:hypothetical protein